MNYCFKEHTKNANNEFHLLPVQGGNLSLKWNLERTSSAVSQLFGTIRAVDVLFMHDEALVGQGQRALLTIKAVLMPSVVLIIHHICPFAKTCKKHIYVGVKQEMTYVHFVNSFSL